MALRVQEKRLLGVVGEPLEGFEGGRVYEDVGVRVVVDDGGVADHAEKATVFESVLDAVLGGKPIPEVKREGDALVRFIKGG